jgi:outer membrane protein OmpA-like peptidoglycan-associated protein
MEEKHMENLLNLLKAALPNNFASLVSQLLGEPEANTETSLSALLPALLGAIFKKGLTPSGAGDLLHLLKTENIDSDILNNIAGILAGSGNAANELVHHGSALVTQLFSDQETALGESLASLGGIKSSSAMDLLALAVPVVLGFLKKYILGANLDQNSLASLFAGQGQYLEGQLDNRLLKALGFASPTAFFSGFTQPKVEPRTEPKVQCPIQPKVEPLTQPKVEPMAKPAYVPEPEHRRSGRWLPWLLGLLGLLGLLYLWQVFSKPSVPPAVKAPAMAPVAFCLPANVYFEVGLAVIDAANQETVNKTAQCIKKEGLKVALSGYTDRTGDWQTNVELAKNRAMVVRDALVAAGVPETSIAMSDPKEWTGTTTGTGSDREARRVEITKQ